MRSNQKQKNKKNKRETRIMYGNSAKVDPPRLRQNWKIVLDRDAEPRERHKNEEESCGGSCRVAGRSKDTETPCIGCCCGIFREPRRATLAARVTRPQVKTSHPWAILFLRPCFGWRSHGSRVSALLRFGVVTTTPNTKRVSIDLPRER